MLLKMAKHKHFHIILIGFLFLKESSTNLWKNENVCTPSSQGLYEQFPPYVVIIKTNPNEEILCQGTLINVNWVLTSAQCMNNNNISLANINLTMGNRTQKSIRKAKKIIVHKNIKNNNVAIIEMNRPIIVTDIITPIKLATEDLSQKMKCVVSGFQKYSNDDLSFIYWTKVNISKQMYDKNEWYLEDTICHKQLWSLRNIINKGIILVCDQYLYGINFVNKPRAFYNILNYKNWIQNMIDQSITNEITTDTNKPFTRNNYLLSYINKSENNDPTSPKDSKAYSTLTPSLTDYSSKTNSSTIETTVTNEIHETEDPNSVSPTQLLTTKASTPYSKPLIVATEETEDEYFTRQPMSSTTVTQSSTTKTSTSSPTPLTVSTVVYETLETEDDPFPDDLTSDTTVTQSSSAVTSTPNSNHSTAVTKETTETAETEDWKYTVTMHRNPTVSSTTNRVRLTSLNTTTTTTTITNQPLNSTDKQIPSNSSTTSSSETEKTYPTTTKKSDESTYSTKSTDETSTFTNSSEKTTFVNESSSVTSCSQIISFNVNCVTVLCCIIFYLTL